VSILVRWSIGVLLVAVVLWLLLTSAEPLGSQQAAPSPTDVGAAREAYHQLRSARGHAKGNSVTLGPAHLDGIGAVASHGFRPDRLEVSTSGAQLRIGASHQLPMGRWLNLTAVASGPSSGFPPTRVRVGALSFPPGLSRVGFEAGRWLLQLRGADIPPLDTMVRRFQVRNGVVTASIALGRNSGVVDNLAGTIATPVDTAAVIRTYCTLAAAQRKRPSADFAEHVRRAFSINAPTSDRASLNAAAFMALGMLLVDERVADLARVDSEDVGRCRTAPIPVQIYGRGDWPKHWTLSAALAVGAGAQLSQAAGEWKELADSLRPKSDFAVGVPSGFSMSDLAADRAGFRVARFAVTDTDAGRIAARLSRATPQELLPYQLVNREDGLNDAEFAKRYGSVDDPRFKKRLEQIDRELDKNGLR
jgi:hypothetical protein